MRFLCKNLAPIYVALVAAAVAWIFGGTMSYPLLLTVPWLMLFMLELLVAFPQNRADESSYDARERVWEQMKRDPVVWVAFGVIVMLCIPFANYGLCPSCDATAIALGARPDPPTRILPFCINRYDHLNVFLWFVTALSCMVATRHSMTAHGKRLVLEMIVWNAAILAVFGFVEIATEAPGPFWQFRPDGSRSVGFFATWGYPNMAGDYFTFAFCLAIALWRWHFDEEREIVKELAEQTANKPRDLFWKQNYCLIPALLCFLAAINTLSRAAMILVTVAAVVFFIHAFVSFAARVSRARRVKAFAICGTLFGLAVFFTVSFMPKSIRKEVNTIDTTGVLTRVTGKGEGHVHWATELWKDYPFFGCGGWGYRHFANSLQTKEQIKARQNPWGNIGNANVHNDYMQFLAEHGLFGLGAFVALIILLLRKPYRVWKVLVKTAHFQTGHHRLPRPVRIFALPAPVFCILVGVVATSIHAFADCPLRSPAILTVYFVSLAAIEGFLPDVEQEDTSRHHHHHHH